MSQNLKIYKKKGQKREKKGRKKGEKRSGAGAGAGGGADVEKIERLVDPKALCWFGVLLKVPFFTILYKFSGFAT